jgi:hypothetical protein
MSRSREPYTINMLFFCSFQFVYNFLKFPVKTFEITFEIDELFFLLVISGKEALIKSVEKLKSGSDFSSYVCVTYTSVATVLTGQDDYFYRRYDMACSYR